ncbi:MAG: hypothetical protein AAGK97_07075, partial [Bacteroidota bacterium]
MENSNYLDEIKEIRSIMEQSTKFFSLSGLSGILAGIYALIGSFLAYQLIYDSEIYNIDQEIYRVFLIYAAVFILALSTGIFLSYRKASKNGEKLWTKASRRMLINFFVPLACGGIFIYVLFMKDVHSLIAPASLIFYGLALLNAGNFTFSDMRYLGYTEIILGIVAAFLPPFGIVTWALGFGIL